jgi:predicted Zn-dependent protease
MRGRHFIALLLGVLVFGAPAFAGPSGKEIYDETVATIGIYEDPELTAYLQGLMNDIISVSEMAGEQFTFTLLDSQEINAFATADNYVYINRGLLNYIQNEAQLVSVLAHEVGHITEKHVSVMPAVAGGAKFLAWLAGALAGNQEVMLAGQAYANSLLKGHGRDNELDADEAAARYMVKLGYDPEQMLEMLSTMKNLETLQKERAARAGAPRQTYHGIFSSHPRNDMRLRSALGKAKAIDAPATRDAGADRYRAETEGIVWGVNFQEKEDKPERYADQVARVRFDYPDGWTWAEDPPTRSVTGQPADGAASLSMLPQPRTPQTAEEYLYNYLNVRRLREGREIEPARLKGYTGILPGEDGKPDRRIAVVYYKMNAFLFSGAVSDQQSFKAFDEKFLGSIDTFRPISSREVEGQKPETIHWVKATGSTTFEALGEHFGLDEHELQDLRLINGYWPSGEPKPGQWIRVFEQEPD